jgi:hypothetical protein
MRIMLYNLLDTNGKVSLNIGLSGCLVGFDNHHSSVLEIDLPTGLITLNKYEYLNTGKVYDSGKVFFIVATKSFSAKQIKRLLLQHACNKIDSRLAHLESLKLNYKKLLAA